MKIVINEEFTFYVEKEAPKGLYELTVDGVVIQIVTEEQDINPKADILLLGSLPMTAEKILGNLVTPLSIWVEATYIDNSTLTICNGADCYLSTDVYGVLNNIVYIQTNPLSGTYKMVIRDIRGNSIAEIERCINASRNKD